MRAEYHGNLHATCVHTMDDSPFDELTTHVFTFLRWSHLLLHGSRRAAEQPAMILALYVRTAWKILRL